MSKGSKRKFSVFENPIVLLSIWGLLALVSAFMQTILSGLNKEIGWFETEGVFRSFLMLYLMAIGYTIYCNYKEVKRSNEEMYDLEGICITDIFTKDEYYEFLIMHVEKAKKIDTLNFIPEPPELSNKKNSRSRYYAALNKRITKDKLTMSRVLSIQNEKLLMFAKEEIDRYKDCNNYSLAHIDIGVQTKPAPLLTFIIIDDEIVCFGLNRQIDVSRQKHVCIKSKKVTEAFMDYYKSIHPDMLKDSSGVHEDVLGKIEAKIIKKVV